MQVTINGNKYQTIQTHNAVSVPATNGVAVGSWIDADGFKSIGVTLKNDASTNSTVDIQWSHDGNTAHGKGNAIPTGTSILRDGIVDTKARYFQLLITNTDAAAHIMSAWAYLKV